MLPVLPSGRTQGSSRCNVNDNSGSWLPVGAMSKDLARTSEDILFRLCGTTRALDGPKRFLYGNGGPAISAGGVSLSGTPTRCSALFEVKSTHQARSGWRVFIVLPSAAVLIGQRLLASFWWSHGMCRWRERIHSPPTRKPGFWGAAVDPTPPRRFVAESI